MPSQSILAVISSRKSPVQLKATIDASQRLLVLSRCDCMIDGRAGSNCEDVTEQACIAQCSGHGDCLAGWCKCFTGYYGHDCAQRRHDSPVLSGECQLTLFFTKRWCSWHTFDLHACRVKVLLKSFFAHCSSLTQTCKGVYLDILRQIFDTVSSCTTRVCKKQGYRHEDSQNFSHSCLCLNCKSPQYSIVFRDWPVKVRQNLDRGFEVWLTILLPRRVHLKVTDNDRSSISMTCLPYSTPGCYSIVQV